MHPARIAELLQPFLADDRVTPALSEAQGLTTDDLHDISTYIDLLLRWNARINLTAIRDPEAIVTRHFGESFFAARHLFPGGRVALQSLPRACRGGRVSDVILPGALAPEGAAQDLRPNTHARPSVADLGSGAGFPGLPIKLWAPAILLTLIESNHKKVAFLREITRALRLTDVNILAARAETLPASSFHLVTLRAVERFAAILPAAADLVAPEGRLALLIGAAQFDEARSSLRRFSWHGPVPIPLSRSRILAVAARVR
jgi:16S rRNA (guanine527-N7)-methyltransferase